MQILLNLKRASQKIFMQARSQGVGCKGDSASSLQLILGGTSEHFVLNITCSDLGLLGRYLEWQCSTQLACPPPLPFQCMVVALVRTEF